MILKGEIMARVTVPVLLCWLVLVLSTVHTLTDGAVQSGLAYHHSYHHHHYHHHTRNTSRCVNGELHTDHTCTCDPCWDGPTCSIYVDLYGPRFLVHAATAVLPHNATGEVYQAWSTDEDLGLTCPLGPGESACCPCASVTYQLFAPPGDQNFLLDPVSGILTKAPGAHLHPGATYNCKIMVQGSGAGSQMSELLYDLLDLRIYVSADNVNKIPWT